MHRTKRIVLSIVGLMAAAAAAFFVGRGSSVPARVAPTSGVADPHARVEVTAVAPGLTTALPPTTNVEAHDDPRLAAVHDAKTLATYLDALEADARGHVSGDEIPRAIRAGRAAEPAIGAVQAQVAVRGFVDRLRILATVQRLKPTKDTLEGLRTRIAAEREPVARQQLIAQYSATSSTLPPIDRLEAMDRLKSLQ